MDTRDLALLELGHALRALDYHFVSVTPETHRRVLARDARCARSMRDVFGWSRPFLPEALPRHVLALAEAAGVIAHDETGLRATVRFSTLSGRLLVHSAFPTLAPDSVFFGPDTHRFCAFVERVLSPASRLVDVGCGSGAGGLVAARLTERVVLSDVNPLALRFARINAALAGIDAEFVQSDVLQAVTGRVDAVIANPPYMLDASGRTYRDGGGQFGEGLSLRIVRESLARFASKGALILYTGSPIVEGEDLFRRATERLCRDAGASLRYEELDPDVFGGELDEDGYSPVERIAAVGLVATMP